MTKYYLKWNIEHRFDVPNCINAFTVYVITSMGFLSILLAAHNLEDSKYVIYCCGSDYTTHNVHTAMHNYKIFIISFYLRYKIQ